MTERLSTSRQSTSSRTTDQTTTKEGWVRRGKSIWKVAPGYDDLHVADFEMEAIAQWVVDWAPYFHPMNNLAQVSREVERYVAGRFAIPVELRKQFAAAIERLDAWRPRDDDDD